MKLAQWFWTWRFQNFDNVFLLFRNYFHLVIGMAHHLNKPESLSSKDALVEVCQVWLKLAQWFWKRRLLNFVQIFLLFRIYLPLEREWAFIWTSINSFYPRMLFSSLVEIGPVVLEKKMKKLKKITTTATTTMINISIV